jgi:hypothetical protein
MQPLRINSRVSAKKASSFTLDFTYLTGSFCLEMVVQCVVREKVPIPAYETFEDRTGLTRRYFMFFDTYFKAARHNKELWDIATNDKGGKNDIPYGSCIFEAHVRTTIRENYFKWILQVLGNPRLIKNDTQAQNFKTEYDYDFESLPNRLICDTVLTRLPKNCQIVYNKTAKEFQLVLDTDCDDSDDSVSEFQSVDSNRIPGGDDQDIHTSNMPKNFKDIQDQQAGNIQNVVDKCRNEHQGMLQLLRQKITELRALELIEPVTKASTNACKEAWAEAKKSLRQFTDTDRKRNACDSRDDEKPKKKKRRKTNIENKSRCSDSKVAFFSNACLELQKEDESGLRHAWETLYKHIKNNYKVEGEDNEDSDDSDDENNNVAVPILPKHSTLLTNLENCRVWRKARNSGITQQSVTPYAV